MLSYARAEYDSAGRLTKVILPEPEDGAGYPEYKYIYDDYGNLAGILDPLNRLTVFKYDEMNRQTERYAPFIVSDPASIQDVADVYGELGTVSPTPVSEMREYNDLGQLVKATDFKEQLTVYSYDSRGLLEYKRYYQDESYYSQYYPSINANPQFYYEYDGLGRRTGVTVTHYDDSGIVISADSYVYVYDIEGRLHLLCSPQGYVRYDYSDVTGRKQAVRAFDPTVSIEDVLDELPDDDDTRVSYLYDELGRLGTGQVHKRNGYEPTTDEKAIYGYNPVGSRQTLLYPNGNLAEYTYDALNRLTTLTNWKDSGKVENDKRSRFAYKLAADGMRKQAIEFFTGEGTDTRTATYNYDNLNRILEETALASDGTYSTEYTYDLVGNRTQRIVTVTNNEAGKQILTTTYEYDPATDQLLREVHTGPEWAVMFDGRPIYAYADGTGGVVYRDGQARIGQFKAFLLGLPTKWSQHALAAVLLIVPTAFCLPAMVVLLVRLGRAPPKRQAQLSLYYRCVSVMLAYVTLMSPACLQSLAEGAIQYSQLDARHWTEGNRTVEYAYDDNGSLTSKVTSVTSSQVELERIEYTYNLQNRLVEVRTSTDEGQSWSVVEYKYDPDGNRVAKIVDGITTDYLIDAYNHTGYSQVFVETTGTDKTAYIIADDVLAQATGNAANAPKYLLYDGHGSTRQLSDNTGNVIGNESYSYDAYGVMLGGNPGSASNPDAPATNLLYAGEQFDIDAQQYYLRARYYDPLNGRFNQMDPFAGNNQDPQSLHKYLYCHANPVNNVDPSGEYSLTEMLTVATIVGTVMAAVAGTVTLVAGGSAREALSQATKWFWISFVFTAAVYGAIWLTHAILVAVFGAGAGLGDLQHAKEYGIQTFNNLTEAVRGTGLERHHIIPQRFAELLGLNEGDMLSIVVTPAEHQVFTNAWRNAISYGADTASATKEIIWQHAEVIYKGYPALVEAARATLGI